MKISKILTALAVAAAVAGFASCSNSSDTPAVPNTPATPATPEGPAVLEEPSVKITGSNVIAAAATSLLHERTSTNLYAFPSNFGSDTIKFTWSVVEGSEHVENPTKVYDERLRVYSKDGDTSVDSADQTFKVKVLVQSTTNASKKAEAEYTVTILKKATAAEGKVPLKFIEWMPEFPYVYDNYATTSDCTFKPKTPSEAITPGSTASFNEPTPIYNGYSAYKEDSGSFEWRKGWTYTTSDKTVAGILAEPAHATAPESEATWTDANGIGAAALIVNKTEKESVTLTVAGEYKLSDDVKPAFTRTVTRKVAKGKKITVKLLKGQSQPSGVMYNGQAVLAGYIELTDVYAGVDYTTKEILDNTDTKVVSGITSDSEVSNVTVTDGATANSKLLKFRAAYDVTSPKEITLEWAFK